ncbi:N-6 DNA methylase [Actinoallomurus purpureus]|uniref:Eco57I restriction-modification methylase domain-containing protein n=1 Tax=Actinoallomurus purpureus TaxID=478114 RepID=UPI0020930BF5|nr:N-6 DNA methylase [Actinoallomurus purpureus]MCO6011527.1 N-6 DNA methylase [Actinoallomurus purpureus]
MTGIKRGQELAAQVARSVDDRLAVAWVHTAALVQHAARLGLIPAQQDMPGSTVDSIRAGVEQIAAVHPGLADLTDPRVTPIWDQKPDEDDAAAIVAAWRDTDLNPLRHRPDGYLLGDLYQGLSVEARKGRALCQTPQFITDLLLDISYDHAYREHGPHIRMIDPSCGTGHILVESLIRGHIRQRHGFGRAEAPAIPWRTPALERVAAALETVHGVDLDPYAVLLARYRLLVMARALLRGDRATPTASELAALPLNVAAADSLLATDEPLLTRGAYHAVVANPPYITCKDKATNEAIRARYPEVCHSKFSLALPFHALMTELLVPGGWCAQLTANSFMKREFGKRYVEQWLTRLDLRWVIDTSGAYIPGHGTPTVILVNRNQPPAAETVHAVLGVRGEPSRPADPAQGVVWRAIASAVREKEAFIKLAAALNPIEPAPVPGSVPVLPDPGATSFEQPSLFDLLESAA